MSDYEQRANFFKALAHPSRLIILDELSKGERCVCDLQQLVGADMSTVSKHLSVMKNAGVVKQEKRGLKVFYSLKLCCLSEMLSCIKTNLDSTED